ncbi:hypothetical protein AVEN_184044-1 [Araneus ventricosus]|uniref:Uncharacterized protein n=1 Tax=Araneus ventricosus TaxID=182803 RepID=A0A4Y2UQJ3_ARAVE|nr:hypothetical protein AVEN_184044-1 [Araneus ventricosus]
MASSPRLPRNCFSLSLFLGQRWSSIGFRAGGFHVRIPIPLKPLRVWGLLHLHVVAKCPPAVVVCQSGEEVPAQVSSSSSDRHSKWRGPSQNSPRVVSKRDFNRTELKCL